MQSGWIVGLALCMVACAEGSNKEPLEEAPKTETELLCLPANGGAFRGVNLGSGRDEVLKAESEIPAIDTDTLLVYHFPVKGDDIAATAFYSFDEYGLFEIQVDLFVQKEQKAAQLYQELKAYLGSRFGEADCKGTTCRFSTVSKSNNLVEITLSNESGEDEPFISLNFLEPLSDAY